MPLRGNRFLSWIVLSLCLLPATSFAEVRHCLRATPAPGERADGFDVEVLGDVGRRFVIKNASGNLSAMNGSYRDEYSISTKFNDSNNLYLIFSGDPGTNPCAGGMNHLYLEDGDDSSFPAVYPSAYPVRLLKLSCDDAPIGNNTFRCALVSK